MGDRPLNWPPQQPRGASAGRAPSLSLLVGRPDWLEWHRGYDDPDSLLSRRGRSARAIGSWFGRAGFREEAFDISPDGFMAVGGHRLTGDAEAFVPGQRLFTFVSEA
jgi:hypothetical protein